MYRAAPFLVVFILIAAQISLYAEQQPPSPVLPHTASHRTKLAAALDQPGTPITTNREEAGSLGGKRIQVVRGLFPVIKDYTLYVNGLDVKTNVANGLSAKGLEIKIVHTIKGGSVKTVFVESRYVDEEDIPKLQEFITTMSDDAQSKRHDADDHSQSSYVTTGGTTFGLQHNGDKSTDYFVLNEPTIVYDFHLKSDKDVSKLKDIMERAAAWVTAQQ